MQIIVSMDILASNSGVDFASIRVTSAAPRQTNTRSSMLQLVTLKYFFLTTFAMNLDAARSKSTH